MATKPHCCSIGWFETGIHPCEERADMAGWIEAGKLFEGSGASPAAQ